MNGFENRTLGSVTVKIGVKVEPTREFSDVAYALGFVRVVPCHYCELQKTPECPMKNSAEYMAFCSNGRRADDNGD